MENSAIASCLSGPAGVTLLREGFESPPDLRSDQSLKAFTRLTPTTRSLKEDDFVPQAVGGSSTSPDSAQ